MSCPRKFTFGVCVMISTLTAAWPCSQALPLYYHASTSMSTGYKQHIWLGVGLRTKHSWHAQLIQLICRQYNNGGTIDGTISSFPGSPCFGMEKHMQTLEWQGQNFNLIPPVPGSASHEACCMSSTLIVFWKL